MAYLSCQINIHPLGQVPDDPMAHFLQYRSFLKLQSLILDRRTSTALCVVHAILFGQC